MGQIEWYNSKLGAPVISIGKNGLTFTPASRALMGDPEYVRVGVNSRQRTVYIAPTADKDDHAIEFRGRANKLGYVRLNQRDITRFIMSQVPDLSLEKATKYIPVWNEKDQMLEVDLSTPLGAKNQGKRKRNK